jgi:hypothetical protein
MINLKQYLDFVHILMLVYNIYILKIFKEKYDFFSILQNIINVCVV